MKSIEARKAEFRIEYHKLCERTGMQIAPALQPRLLNKQMSQTEALLDIEAIENWQPPPEADEVED